MEKSIRIGSKIGFLEGMLSQKSETKAVVVTHPHSLYGGNMENSVVHTISAVYQSHGFSVLRFNFRGVGESSGAYSEGIGEMEDLANAISFLQANGYQEITLTGYSFGSWVIFNHAVEQQLQNDVVLVSPPVDFIPFDRNGTITNLQLVVVGEKDEYAPVEKLRSAVSRWNKDARVEIVPDADHFYSGYHAALSKILLANL